MHVDAIAEALEKQHRLLVDPTTGEQFQVPLSFLGEITHVKPATRLSMSRLGTLLRCGMLYEFEYVREVKVPDIPVMVVGRTYHDALQHLFTEKRETGNLMSIETLVEHFQYEFTKAKSLGSIDWNHGVDDDKTPRTPDQWAEIACTLLATYRQTVASKVQPKYIEEPFAFPLDGTPYTLTGRIDLETEDRVIIDHKFVKRKRSQGEADKDIQPSAYAVYYYMKDRRRSKPVRFEFHCAVDRKDPGIEIVSTQRDLFDVRWYIELARKALRQIESGIFIPNPTSMICTDTCRYWDICRGERARRVFASSTTPRLSRGLVPKTIA